MEQQKKWYDKEWIAIVIGLLIMGGVTGFALIIQQLIWWINDN